MNFREYLKESIDDTELEVFTKFLDMLITKSNGKPDGHEIFTHVFKLKELEQLLQDKPLAKKLTNLRGPALGKLETLLTDVTEKRTKKDIENLYIFPQGKTIEVEIQYDY